jgi:uncharacterized damage-inducible protein DinB
MAEPFDAYLSLFELLHQQVVEAIDGLPDEALDWLPAEGMNSVAVLVVHMAGSLRYWVGDVAAQEPSDRERSAEFLVRGLTSGELKQRLAASREYTREIAGRLTLEDLGNKRTSAMNDREITVSWALLHALEHTALHVGHIQMTRQLWDHFAAGNRQ